MGKKRLFGVLAALGAVYAAYPYATLYALQLSVEHGRPTAIEPFIAWDSVREGLKEDACDDVADAAPAVASTTLPPFGSGFVHAIAANMIDTAVTPDSVADMLRGLGGKGGLHVDWAFFDGLRTFMLEMAPDGAASDQEPFKLRLDLDGGVWRITRAWLPHWMLERAVAART